LSKGRAKNLRTNTPDAVTRTGRWFFPTQTNSRVNSRMSGSTVRIRRHCSASGSAMSSAPPRNPEGRQHEARACSPPSRPHRSGPAGPERRCGGDKIPGNGPGRQEDQVKAEIPSLLSKYPNNPGVLYLQAQTTSEGAEAVRIYQSIVDNFPRVSGLPRRFSGCTSSITPSVSTGRPK